MKFLSLIDLFTSEPTIHEDQMKAGTGFMRSLTDAILDLQKKGYVENLVPCYDHLTCQSGAIRMYPREFFIDEMMRFENSSDPGDQSILYAITCDSRNLKGLYIESYGTYHDELSEGMIERIKFCRSNRKTPTAYEGKIRLLEVNLAL